MSCRRRRLHQLPQSFLHVGTDLVAPTRCRQEPRHIYRRWCIDEVTRNEDVIIMFRHSATTTLYPSISAAMSLVTRCQSLMSVILSRLDYGRPIMLHCIWHPWPPSSSTSSVGNQRRCQNDLFDVAFKSHLTVPASAALVESSWTNWLQVSRLGVQVPAWDWSSLSSWCSQAFVWFWEPSKTSFGVITLFDCSSD